ncbi:CD2 antigen cytoplasmic tail-binding protein 2 homolog isoform X2 [Anthonomus grandis grandis]|uniref:CD2 antigen cytoplasmic tail-binding protein 2 homolog isoform X1 n=1 Tax=Anthonomus grandis grandis TaxID=2921223 RepID=UPI002166B761|nr:CD2 antigen cytoplasmic tail-binding protein 2 homolog isoform X1 [Anthonomus grandis grandis]XP_050299090.1 CD2 antigen cytoplasmic tail-binding protein 2 homolog isoform X2 [Anthonomus grandis grandis]
MSKRKYQNEFYETTGKRFTAKPDQKKHTLDSDEEDFVDDTNVLNEDDIEGEEDGLARQDGEQKMTAFNMREELEEGHFDRDGHFIWKNEKEVRDNWLDNIDWQKIKHNSETAGKYDIEEAGLAADSDSEEEMDEDFSEIDTYKKILSYMKPKETINQAIKRLGGEMSKLSSLEKLKRKKAGTLVISEDVTKLTELANQILTKLGNMDVYQETYEQIQAKIENKSKGKKTVREPELDMYSDDFESKEQEKLKDEPSSSTQITFHEPLKEQKDKRLELEWEFKWSAEDEKIEGPINTAQMIKWQRENYFKTGVMVRKYGENSNFYSLSRIDFELYE